VLIQNAKELPYKKQPNKACTGHRGLWSFFKHFSALKQNLSGGILMAA